MKLMCESPQNELSLLGGFFPARLVCVLIEARATIVDEIIELHERILGSMFAWAKYKQVEYLQKTGKLIQQKAHQYVSVGLVILDVRNVGTLSAIERVLP
ncbi:hypothetical protein GNW65_23430 [Escherichia coli]|uniref:hypothetical protein n=1 Tax=Escherichia coli TaxID=562 RepID=UPI0011251321|nr:hypothetical protein [Escherichia coli]EII1146456.1 hypothetical protein [Escherichia coli O121]EEU3950851.1 hypothetical protein [Escherichia coli]EEU4080850.1 hypothetical protein [Escherichia coli]EEX3345520.1 hypothetical protein [Escherichia coli]EFA5525013.1 hypothetical protein [Escherichia coli]